MDNGFLDALVTTVGTYQTAYNTFLRENKNDKELAKEMTADWWYGIMISCGITNQKNNDEWRY